jgi:glycerol-3-phosphate dehydrogenase
VEITLKLKLQMITGKLIRSHVKKNIYAIAAGIAHLGYGDNPVGFMSNYIREMKKFIKSA